MITKVELKEVVKDLKDIKVMLNHILVLVPTPSETTDSGIIKGDKVVQDETDKLESFMHVLKVHKDSEEIEVFDKVFTQGQVLAFTEKSGVKELEIAPEGYAVGLVPTPYVKLVIKA